jgi:hypothetical protein
VPKPFFSILLKVEGGSNPHRSRFTKTVTPGDIPGVTASPAMTSPPGEFSVIKNRPLFSFGSRSMSPHHRRLYRAGYGLMMVGWFFGIGAVLAQVLR